MAFVKTAALIAALASLIGVSAAQAAETYYNISNVPFATVSNGPQDAIIVDVANPNDRAQVQSAVAQAMGRVGRASGGALAREIAFLKKTGRLRADARPPIYPTILVRSAGRVLPATRAGRSFGGGTITFVYEGWPLDQEDLLRRFGAIAYPIVRQIYGDPARTITVHVIRDNTLTDRQAFVGGIYVTGAGEAQIRIYNTQGRAIDIERDFLHLMIRAFHDTALFSYDAWEEGFSRAAAVAAGELIDREIQRQNPPGMVELDLVGRGLGGGWEFYYLMAAYEILNQPALSNSKFAQWSGELGTVDVWGGMLIPRLGMSSTAWLKVYIEQLRRDGRSFFKLFNEEYYRQLPANQLLPGNVPALKSIAAAVTPAIENQFFDEWFRKQFIFDTSVSIGKKLYAFALPPAVPVDPATEGYTENLFVLYYSTTSTGDETPLSATVYPAYWDYLYKTDIFLSPQYETVAIENGLGTVAPTFFVENIGGAQRIAIDLTIGTETARVYFPAGMSGTAAGANNLMGCVIGADSGGIDARVGSDVGFTSTLVMLGAFGEYLPSLLDFSKLTITYTPTTGDPVTKVINVGPGPYVTLINAATVSRQVSHLFEAGLRMISIPIMPYAQNQAEALTDLYGNPVLGQGELLLARWNPLLSDTYKYEMYPKTPPFLPGRGYWAKLPRNLTVAVTGQVPDPTSQCRIGLELGWNQIGGPFETPVPVTSLLVEKANDDPLTLSDAASRGLVGRIIWEYIPGTGYREAVSLDPWEGCWIKCNVPEGAVLIVPGPQNAAGSRSAPAETVGSGRRAADSRDRWSIKLSASSNPVGASVVTLGVARGATDGFDNAFDAEFPPAFEKALTVAAALPGRAGEAFAVDTKAAGSVKTSWDVVVHPSEPNQDIVLRWQDIGAAPKRCKLTLVDPSTGRSRFMRTTSSLRFNSGDGSPRRFTIVADSSPTTRLMITNLSAGRNRGGGATFSYNLTVDAQVAAEIVGPGGRRVRRLDSGRAARSGINSLAWDGRDDEGRPAPAGAYILELTAATEEGEMVKSIRPVLVAR